MASSLSGASALGIFDNVIDYAGHCQRCVDDGNAFSCAICDQRPAGVAVPTSGCAAGQVQWSENGVDKCGSMAEYNAFVAKATGAGVKPAPAKTSSGGFVKPTVPGIPVQPAQAEIPWGGIALAALAVGGFLVWRKKHMTSNSHDYDLDY